MIELLAQWFPAMVAFGAIAGIFLAVSLKSRISGGSSHAGPMNQVAPIVPGLTSSAWDAQSIELALAHQPEAVVTLLETLAQTLETTRTTAHSTALGLPPLSTVEHMLNQLEQQLELDPLTSVLPPPPPPSGNLLSEQANRLKGKL